MATHFSANQYENAFAANRLQNYEIPSSYKEHPTPRKGTTKIVGNDRGHLNPGVPRSTESPWGNFKGTWDEHMDCSRTKHCEKLIQSNAKLPSVLKNSNVRYRDGGNAMQADKFSYCAAAESSCSNTREGCIAPTPRKAGQKTVAFIDESDMFC